MNPELMTVAANRQPGVNLVQILPALFFVVNLCCRLTHAHTANRMICKKLFPQLAVFTEFNSLLFAYGS